MQITLSRFGLDMRFVAGFRIFMSGFSSVFLAGFSACFLVIFLTAVFFRVIFAGPVFKAFFFSGFLVLDDDGDANTN